MGRPRKLRDEDGDENVEGSGVEEKGTTDKGFYINHKIGHIKPYISRQELPPGKMKEKTDKQGKKYFIKAGNGEMRYKFVECKNGVFKLLQICSTGKGTLQRLVGMLKTKRKDARGRSDRKMIERLRREGFPGL